MPSAFPLLGKHFPVFTHRNYRLFFVGQSISLIGSWLTTIATSWLVYRLTNSAFALGLVNFVNTFPSLLVSPFAGVYADRWDRHKVLLLTQAAAMLQSLALAILTLSGMITMPQLIFLSLIQGIINAVDMPNRQAFVFDMVEDYSQLSSAIGLNSVMFNAARLIGPSLGGMLIALSGEGVCFLIDALSYLAVLYALWLIQVSPRVSHNPPSKTLESLTEGFRYAFGFKPIGSLILLVAVISLMITPYSVLLPVLTKEIFQGGPATLGTLMAASGLGALCAALYLAVRKTVIGLGNVISIAGLVLAVSLMLFSFVSSLTPAMFLLFLIGGSIILIVASSNTLLQTLADTAMRGRVASFYTTAFIGMTPFGSLLAGSLATHIGPQQTICLGGVVCLLATLVFIRKLPLLRKLARPVFVERGIIVSQE